MLGIGATVHDDLREALNANRDAHAYNQTAMKQIRESNQKLSESLEKARAPFADLEYFVRHQRERKRRGQSD